MVWKDNNLSARGLENTWKRLQNNLPFDLSGGGLCYLWSGIVLENDNFPFAHRAFFFSVK